jgi:hypothetical protein
MPTNYSGLEIETPQEVLGRLRDKRTEMLATNNPLLMQRATIEEGIQAAFGSPEERKASRVQKVLGQASKLPAVEGEDDVTSSLRRLAAMRDAVVDIDPAVADKITTEMLKLGTIRQERLKLQGDIDRTAGQEKRDRELHPGAVAEQGIAVVQKAAEMEPWMNPTTGKYTAVAAADMEGKQDLATRGYVPAGKPTLQGGKNELLGTEGQIGLTKPSMNAAQESYMGAGASLDMLAQTMQKYDPAFSTMPAQWLAKGQGWYEKFGGTLTPEQKATHGQFTSWKRNTVDGLNRYIKAITGAQMAVAEADRIKGAYPKPEDGPTEYINNVREVTKQLLQVQKRSASLMSAGITLEGDQFLKVPLPDVTEAEVDDYMARTYGITAPVAPGTAETPEQRKARIRAGLKSNP